MDFYGFYTGKIFDAYKYLGAHVEEKGVTFRTFAPSASRITLIGEFNDWQEWEMNKVSDGNFWECYVPQAKAGQMYKYKIYDRNSNPVDHCDPYGFGMELRPSSASIIRDMSKYKFKDSQWLQSRSDCRKKPLNIYEIHFGSFLKPSDKADDWYNYEEMIDILIPYLVKNGYNYLEIMPLNEYPCDESWGYQATGFFSPTSRYGTADQLKAFIDACHKHNIGVLMDFVPVHFAVDAYGLRITMGPHFMNIRTLRLVSVNGEVATSCIPAARPEASCSPVQTTGSANSIWMVSVWMRSAVQSTGRVILQEASTSML